MEWKKFYLAAGLLPWLHVSNGHRGYRAVPPLLSLHESLWTRSDEEEKKELKSQGDTVESLSKNCTLDVFSSDVHDARSQQRHLLYVRIATNIKMSDPFPCLMSGADELLNSWLVPLKLSHAWWIGGESLARVAIPANYSLPDNIKRWAHLAYN